MEEYSKVHSIFYSKHPLGVGIDESKNNVLIGTGKFGPWIEKIALPTLNRVNWWSKPQLEDLFGKENIDRLFDRIYFDLCSSGFIEASHIHNFLCEKMFFNSSYPHLGDSESFLSSSLCGFNPVTAIFGFDFKLL